MRIAIILTLVFVAAWGCRPRLSQSDGKGTATPLEVQGVDLELVTEVTDEISDAIAGDRDEIAPQNSADLTGTRRACEKKPDGSVVVTLPKGESRTWIPATGSNIGCTGPMGRLNVDWSNDAVVDGLQMIAIHERTYGLEKSETVTATGTRTVLWSNSIHSKVSMTRTKTIVIDSMRVWESYGSGGQKNARVVGLKTDPNMPLVVRVERAPKWGNLMHKTIESGILIANGSDGTIRSYAFTDLEFDFTKGGKGVCYPQSGSIEVTVNGKTAKVVYSSTASVPIGIAINGVAVDVAPSRRKFCDLSNE